MTISIGGNRFATLYDRYTLPYRDLIEVHQGNILDEIWKPDDRIDLLFLDLCKTPEFNAHVMRTFFPSLAPRFAHYSSRLLLLARTLDTRNDVDAEESFGLSTNARHLLKPTAVKSAIEGYAIDQALGALSDPAVALDCMDAQIESCEFDGGRAHLEMARCVLLKRFGRQLDIDRAIDRIRIRYSGPRMARKINHTGASQRL